MINIPDYIGSAATDSRAVHLHEDAVTQGFAILAMRDSGKSNLAGVMQEEFARRGDQFIVIDPVAAHIGIRNAMGDVGQPAGPSGIEVLIVGGDNSDCPLPTERGRELAQALMETKASAIINLKTARAPERKAFLTDFGEELYARNTSPLHLFLEEADEIIPQQPDNREEQAIRHIWRKIVKGGRSSGLGFTIISQRPALVDKSSLNQIDNLLVMTLMGGGDLKQVEDWLKFHVREKGKLKEIMESIPGLKRGETWFLSPRWLKQMTRFQVRRRVTFHAGRTPKRGEVATAPQKYDLGELAERFKATLDKKGALEHSEAEEVAILCRERDELDAKLGASETRVQSLEHDLGACLSSLEVETERLADAAENVRVERQMGLEQGYRRGYSDGYRAAQEPTLKLLEEMHSMQPVTIVMPADVGEGMEISGGMYGVAEKVRESSPPSLSSRHTGIENAGYTVGGYLGTPRDADPRNRRDSLRVSDIYRAGERAEVKVQSNGSLSGLSLRIVRALAEWHALGRRSMSRDALSALVGARGGYYSNTVSRLKSDEYVDYPEGGEVALTAKGHKAAGDPPRPLSRREVHDRVRATLSGLQIRIFDVVYRAYPNSIDREKLSEMVDARGGYYSNTVSAMKTRTVIDYPHPGQVRAAEWMFIK